MSTQQEAGEPGLRDYLRVVRQRTSVIVTCVALAVGVALALSLAQEKLYEATARVLLQPAEAERVFDSPGGGRPVESARLLQTELDLVRHLPPPADIEQVTERITDISATAADNSDIIKVSATATDPGLAANAANAYAEAYVDLRKQRTAESLRAAARQLEAKVAELDEQIAATSDPDPAASNGQDRQLLMARQSALQEKLDQVLVEASLTSGGVQIGAPAYPPTEPVSPRPARNGLLAAGLGLVLGLGIAFLLDQLDDRVKGKDDLDPLIGDTPVLAMVAQEPSSRGRRRTPQPGTLARADYVGAEAYRSLRTALQFAGVGDRVRVLQVTSPDAGDGKTTILANLALACCQSGADVVVVCCDLRRPYVHQLFGLENKVGLTSVLVDGADYRVCLQRVSPDMTLSVLASGPSAPNPSELLSGPTATKMFAWLRERGDIVLVDSPPLLPVADASVIVGHVDATLLVASAGNTRRRHLSRAIEMLDQIDASVIGVVLNRVSDEDGYGKYSYYDRATTRASTDTDRPRWAAHLRPTWPSRQQQPRG